MLISSYFHCSFQVIVKSSFDLLMSYVFVDTNTLSLVLLSIELHGYKLIVFNNMKS